MLATTLRVCKIRYAGQYIYAAKAVGDESSMGVPVEFSRNALVDFLHAGNAIEAIYLRADGTWANCGNAVLLEIDGIEYIKVIDDGKPLDDLGDVEEF